MSTLENVEWNHSVASAASAALRRAADKLKITAEDRVRSAQAAQAEWLGKHRETFDGELNKLLREAQELADEYRAAAARIDKATADARKEQALRKRMREEQERRKREQSAGR